MKLMLQVEPGVLFSRLPESVVLKLWPRSESPGELFGDGYIPPLEVD